MVPRNTKKRRNVNFMIEEEKFNELVKFAAKNNTTVSDIIRASLDKSMSLKMYEEQEEFIYDNINKAVKEAMKSQTDRLASLVVKGAILEGRTFFTTAKFLELLTQATDICTREEYQEILQTAQILGAKYMGAKEENMDNFMKLAMRDILNNI